MGLPQWLLPVLVVAAMVMPLYADVDSLYCGEDNCYDLLAVTRESTKREITKAYRALAKKWHPDMHKGEKAKAVASERFQKFANAYEILTDEESKRDYDYMLDNPEEFYYNYYRYYRHRVAPKVDARIVVAVTITIISVIQYWSAWNNYKTAITQLALVPKYRLQAQEIARNEGLLGAKRKKDRSKTKEEIKDEEEEILKKVIEEKMQIRGGYGKPTLWQVLWIQLLMSPYYLVCYMKWYAAWIWRFRITGEEYGETEKHYLIRTFMKLSEGQWDTIDEYEREGFMRKELWIKDNFSEWKQQKEDDMRVEMATSARYKSYRRYMKKGGPGQMSFGPE